MSAPVALDIPIDDAIRRAVITGRDAGKAARLVRLPSTRRRVYVVTARQWLEYRAATMRLAAAAGLERQASS